MKYFSWLFVAAFTLTISACGGKKDDAKGSGEAPAAGKGEAAKGGGEIDEARAAELSKLDVAGFERIEGGAAPKGMALPNYVQETAKDNGCKAFVMVNAQKCMMCQPMDLEKWKSNENLKAMLPSAHKDNPNLVWDVEELEAGGTKAISIYERSFIASENTKSTSHGLTVHYNDNVNQLVIQVSARGCPSPEDEAALAALMTKDEMLAVAKTFLGAFAAKM